MSDELNASKDCVRSRSVTRTWAKLSETQRSVLEDAAAYGPPVDCRPFTYARLRTARSLEERGLLIEQGPRCFTRTDYGQKVIDWKNSEL